MVTIRLKGTLTEDRRLVVDIPADVPAGDLDLILEISSTGVPNEATARARAKLGAAGALSTSPAHTEYSSDDAELVELPPGSPSLDRLVNEDRGNR